MRMHAGRREQDAITPVGQRGSLHVALVAAPGHDHSGNARGGRALHHFGTIFVETVMGQVGPDINQ